MAQSLLGTYTTATLPAANLVQPGTNASVTDNNGNNLSTVTSDGVKWSNQLGASYSGAFNGLYGVTAQNTIHLRAALARVRSNTGTCKVAIVGDSTTAGLFAQGVGQGYTNAKVLAPGAQLAAMLKAAGTPAHNESFFGTNNTQAVAYAVYNPAVNLLTGSFTQTTSPPTFCGNLFRGVAVGNTMSWTPLIAFDSIDVYYAQAGSAGSFTVNVDGGATLATVNANNANQIYVKQAITGVALGTHTINLAVSVGTSSFILGMAVRNSTSQSVEVYTLGNSGTTVSNLLRPSGGVTGYLTPAGLQVLGPDMTFINLTINDINNQVTTVAQYSIDLQTIISAALATGDCCLVIGNPGNVAGWTNGIVAPQYQNAVYALAASNGIPVVDITQRWVSYAVTNPVMPYGDAGAGSIHPTAIGYADIASAYRLLFN